MIDNVRYRLDPAAQGDQRTRPLLGPRAAGRKHYENKLASREWVLASHRRTYVERTSALCGVSLAPGGLSPTALTAWPLHPDWVLSMAEGSIRSFRITVETMFGPPDDLVTELSTHADGAERYKTFVKQHSFYATELERLETTERMIDGQVGQAERTIAAQPKETREAVSKRLQAARDAMKEARSVRYAKRGMLYLSEVDMLRTAVWKAEAADVQALFSERERAVAELTQEEELALVERRTEFDSGERVRPPLSRRLMTVRSPTAVDPNGNLAHIFRLTGEVPLNLFYATKPTVHVETAENALVGVVAAARLVPGGQRGNVVEVMPLNDRAIEVFKGGVRGMVVYRHNLAPVTVEELEKAKDALASTRKAPRP
jgi:hypothetical protein